MLKNLCLLTVVFCLFTSTAFAQAASLKNAATKQLYGLFDETWEWNLKESPTFASFLGDKRYNDRWNDISLAAFERRQNMPARH